MAMTPSEIIEIENELSKKYNLLKMGSLSILVITMCLVTILSSGIAYLSAKSSAAVVRNEGSASPDPLGGVDFASWVAGVKFHDEHGYWEFTSDTAIQHQKSGNTVKFEIVEINPERRVVSFRHGLNIHAFVVDPNLQGGHRAIQWAFKSSSK